MPKVFVYGSLKRGQSNAFMMDGAQFVAPARSVQCWRLVALPPGCIARRGLVRADRGCYRQTEPPIGGR